jgi:5-(carboxyamino)imidazole ribonucleotide mutase
MGAKKVLVVFGSSSDSAVYAPIAENIEDSELRICSAHRTPDLLDEILKKKYSLIIAGAGLAAHLPGVIASKTISPVIGVPCKGAFNGLDAYLSILQMPPGYPVLCTGVADNPWDFAGLLLKGRNEVNILTSEENYRKNIARIDKCKETLGKLGCSFFEGDEILPGLININFYDLSKEKPKKSTEQGGLIINVPLTENPDDCDADGLMASSYGCLHLGINRAENAAIAAVELINQGETEGKSGKALLALRDGMTKKVVEDDKRIHD